MVFKKVYLIPAVFFLSLVALYFLTRLTNILALPMFTDEAIYVRWSQIAKQDAAWRFISLTDGKQPMLVWLAMNSMRIFKSDPLFATRMVSVFSGFLAMVGVMLLSLELFKKKPEGGHILFRIFGHLQGSKVIGVIAGILFVLYPFALVLDRMAIYDSLVACTIIWCLYMEVLLVRYLRLDIAIITGAVIGSAVLTKTSGFFAIYLFPFSLLLFDFRQKGWRKKLGEWIVFAGIASAVAYTLYSILRLSPFYYIIDEKNALFVRPASVFLHNILIGNFAWFNYMPGNFNALTGWFATYVGLPVLIAAILSFAVKDHLKEKLLLLVWFLLPFTALGIFGNTLYPRFIYFMTLPVIILAAYTIYLIRIKVKVPLLFSAIFVLICFFYAWADYFIVFDFSHAPIPQADLGQYINSWPAGGGVRQMVSFFQQQSQKGNIYVATQGTFGSLPTYAIEIYLGNNKNIEKRGIYPLPDKIPPDLVQKAKVMPVYYVFNDSENAPASWPLKLIAKYQKGIGDRHLSIYQVQP
ncbi:MAG: ArnT family glycosyltransferase [Candidatus Levyibacteriota bacterium]